MSEPIKLLTIGGTDPCGAFGLYTDLKTFTVLGAHGMGVVTVVTAQNSVGWYGAEFMRPEFIAQQLDAVLSDYKPTVVKTGFLGRVDVIEVVAQKLQAYAVPQVVVDTVLVNNYGHLMFGAEVAAAYVEQLLPLACLITPNVWEAAVLLGQAIDDMAQGGAEQAAEALQKQLGPAGTILLKRAAVGEQITDLFYDGGQFTRLSSPKLTTQNVSGSGDTLSAAITAFLGRGEPLLQAVQHGRAFTQRALAAAQTWQLGQGAGPLGHLQAAD